MKKYEVVVLCGSTSFTDDFIKVQEDLTLKGYIVISPMMFDINSYKSDEKFMEMFHEMHMQKINMADQIFIINKGGYIGNHTQAEIDYALKLNKKITYLENIK